MVCLQDAPLGEPSEVRREFHWIREDARGVMLTRLNKLQISRRRQVCIAVIEVLKEPVIKETDCSFSYRKGLELRILSSYRCAQLCTAEPLDSLVKKLNLVFVSHNGIAFLYDDDQQIVVWRGDLGSGSNHYHCSPAGAVCRST